MERRRWPTNVRNTRGRDNRLSRSPIHPNIGTPLLLLCDVCGDTGGGIAVAMDGAAQMADLGAEYGGGGP